jgi:hypothetical protein
MIGPAIGKRFTQVSFFQRRANREQDGALLIHDQPGA